MEPRLSRPTRLLAAILVGAIHLALQLGLYVLAFAVGPERATREVLGISLYAIATVVTFPFVCLAERLRWAGIGTMALPLNSVAWAGCVYLGLGMAAHLARRKARDR